MTDPKNTILVTGGAGFIGSNFVLRWIETVGTPVVNLDLLTYAGNPANLASLDEDKRYQLRARRHSAMPKVSLPHSKRIALAPSCTSRLRATSIVRSWILRIHPYQRARHLHATRANAALLVGPG